MKEVRDGGTLADRGAGNGGASSQASEVRVEKNIVHFSRHLGLLLQQDLITVSVVTEIGVEGSWQEPEGRRRRVSP